MKNSTSRLIKIVRRARMDGWNVTGSSIVAAMLVCSGSDDNDNDDDDDDDNQRQRRTT